MNVTSLDTHFMTMAAPVGALTALRRRSGALPELVSQLLAADGVVAYDYLRMRALRMADKEEAQNAVLLCQELCEYIAETGDEGRQMSDLHAMGLSVLTALHSREGQSEEALVCGAAALNVMMREPKRKDAVFLSILGSLLYDLAQVHSSRGELKAAEREIEKCASLFERLAKDDPERYGPAHLAAIDAAGGIYRSRVKQANMLAHCQVATMTYMEQLKVEAGDDRAITLATDSLIDSLATQGRTLMQMGRQREAVAYFTRALKFLTKIEPELTLRGLNLSIDLGEALVAAKATRDKGVHLLNTMLHKATKLNADEDHRRIVEILLNVKTNRLDILSIWHKIFPK